MLFSVVNNQGSVPYTQYGTDKQKARATKFVKSNDAELTNLAIEINHRKQNNRKFERNISRTITALPVIAGVAAMITTKGKVSAKSLAGVKNALGVGAAMFGIGAVLNTNHSIVKNNPKVAKTERKHPFLTLAGLSAVATGVLSGASVLLDKVSPKVKESVTKIAKRNGLDKPLKNIANAMDNAPAGIKTMASKIAEKVSLPKNVRENISKIAGKVKMPQFLKEGYGKIANAENTKKAMEMAKGFGKTIGKAALKNPVTATILAVVAISVAHSVKQGMEVKHTKERLKNEQLRTANGLINAYAAENDSLKTANAKAADALEKSNNVIAEGTDKLDEE